MEFEPGDLVRLKSGGALMTVEEIGNGAVWCVWSEKVGNRQVIQRNSFPPVVLAKGSSSVVASARIIRG
jgi:uncharacterized protein YodC (DUF2158 family)